MVSKGRVAVPHSPCSVVSVSKVMEMPVPKPTGMILHSISMTCLNRGLEPRHWNEQFGNWDSRKPVPANTRWWSITSMQHNSWDRL